MQEPPDPITELRRRAWITSGCRFAAHRRLNRQQVWSTWAVAILSVYVIAGSIFAQIIGQVGVSQAVVNLGLIVTSVLVLVLSLIESGRNYQLRADHLHRCAEALRKVELGCLEIITLPLGPERDKRVSRLARRYSVIIESCPDNHNDIDFATFKSQHRDDYKTSWLRRSWIRFRRDLITTGPYLGAMALPLLIVYLLA